LFLDLYLPQCPFYAEIVERVKGGDILLDLGCGLGQELRQLAYDGCPPENLYASDLYAEFGSIGCDLFRDAPIFAAQFLAADVFDESSPLAQRLQGRTDIINATFFFHMWDWEKQVLAAKRIVALLRPRTGSLVVGRHAGHRSPGTSAPGRGTKGGKTRFLHNEETWRELWDRVSLETESRWSVDAWVEEWRAEDPVTRQFKEDGCVVLNFAARRLE
jgi:SAM-dependent methyltransferase